MAAVCWLVKEALATSGAAVSVPVSVSSSSSPIEPGVLGSSGWRQDQPLLSC